jgi:hypothetical protein
MIAQALHRSRWSLAALTAATALAGCDSNSGSSFEPSESPAIATASRGVDLGQCPDLAAPQGSKLVAHVWADGVQIYEWTGAAWTFRRPSATLYADAARTAKIGTHYEGPTWESNGGSIVVGRLKTPCDVGPADIAWLLLDGIRSGGAGIFHDVTSIWRVNTDGGRAPSAPGAWVSSRRCRTPQSTSSISEDVEPGQLR